MVPYVVNLAHAQLVLPRGIDHDEEVEHSAADNVLIVRVQIASLAVGHGDEAEFEDVEGFESKSLPPIPCI